MPLVVLGTGGAAVSAGFAQSATSAAFAFSTAGATGAVVFSSTLSLASALTVTSTVRASGYLVGGTQVITIQQSAITLGDTLVSDTAARSAISAIMSALRAHGLISSP